MKRTLWRLTLRNLRTLLDRVDEWLHVHELAIANAAIAARQLAEVNPVASAKREREYKQFAGVSADGCTSASLTKRRKTTGARTRLSTVRMGPRRQTPRLKYDRGQFVRVQP